MVIHHAIFIGALVASGLGLPPGEDVALLIGGRLLAEGFLHPAFTAPLAIAAVVSTDSIWFFGGRGVGMRVERASLGRTAERIRRRIIGLADRYGHLAVIAARFLPGARAFLIVHASTGGMPLRQFLLLDACAASVWVPFVLWLGAWLLPETSGRWIVDLFTVDE